MADGEGEVSNREQIVTKKISKIGEDGDGNDSDGENSNREDCNEEDGENDRGSRMTFRPMAFGQQREDRQGKGQN